MFYSYPDMNLWCNQVHNVPLVFPEIQVNNAATPTVGFGFAPPVLGRTLTGFTAIDTHLQIPRIDQASVSFERAADGNIDDSGRLPRRLGLEPRSIAARQQRAARVRGGVQPRRPVQTIPFVPGTDLGELPPGVTVASTTFPVGPINLLESTGTSQYNSAWILTKRTFSRRSELPGQLHVLEEPYRLADVPVAERRVRSAAEQFRSRRRMGAGRVRHPPSVRQQRDLQDSVLGDRRRVDR